MSNKQSSTDEKKQTAASYVIAFYQNVLHLNNYYTQYVNYLLEMEKNYGSDFTEMSDEHERAMLNVVQNVRLFVSNIYISFRTIKDTTEVDIDKKEYDKFEEHFTHVKTKFIPEEAEVLEFVLFINKFLVKDVIKELLVDSQSILDGIYN